MHFLRTPVRFRLILSLILFIFAFPVVHAADELAHPETLTTPDVVSEGKRLRGDHRSARVFTESELTRESGRTIGEVLREEAGVDYTEGTAGNSNLFIRGASGSETLVIIDGVKANDPSATNRYFDWSRIDATQIERVEILKGPQAVSYGSDAIGGVVIITTKQGVAGANGSVATSASLEAGSEEFARAHASLAEGLGHAFGADHVLSVEALGKGVFDGGSSAASPDGRPMEGDNSEEVSTAFALRSRWGRETRTNLNASLRSSREDIDAGPFQDEIGSVALNKEIRASGTIDGVIDGGLEYGGLVSYLDFRRAYIDYVNAPDLTLFGTNSRAEFHLRSSADSPFEWTAGLETTRETIADDSLLNPVVLSRTDAETYALFAESVVPLVTSNSATNLVAIDFGARLSSFSSFGNQWSEKGGVNVHPSEALELDAGVSTGFKAPSLYSLYDPQYGNPGLQPEESVQAEAGASVRPEAGELVSVRGFVSWIRNRFGFDPTTYRSLNVARAEIRGVELESETEVVRGFQIAPTLTYLSTEDYATGEKLTDVPRWKGTLKFLADLSARNSITLSMLAKSGRETSVGNAEAPGFFRVDLTSQHSISTHWTFTTRFENVLNHQYEEVYGYRSPGFSVYLGGEYVSL